MISKLSPREQDQIPEIWDYEELREVATGSKVAPYEFEPMDWRVGSIALLMYQAANEIERLRIRLGLAVANPLQGKSGSRRGKRNLNAEMKARIVVAAKEMTDDGKFAHTYDKIGEMFGVTAMCVSMTARAHGLPSRSRVPPPGRKKLLIPEEHLGLYNDLRRKMGERRAIALMRDHLKVVNSRKKKVGPC